MDDYALWFASAVKGYFSVTPTKYALHVELGLGYR